MKKERVKVYELLLISVSIVVVMCSFFFVLSNVKEPQILAQGYCLDKEGLFDVSNITQISGCMILNCSDEYPCRLNATEAVARVAEVV